MAEWLGTGLQNQLQRFESARNLRIRKAPARDASWGFLVAATWKLASVVGDAKKAKGFAQQRTGAFLLTLGDQRSAERSEGNPRQALNYSFERRTFIIQT